MVFFMSSRFAGFHVQHLAAPRPAIQIVTCQKFSRCISTRILPSHSISVSKALPNRPQPALPKPISQNVSFRRLRHRSSSPPRDRVRRKPTRDSEIPLEYHEASSYTRAPPRRNPGNVVLGGLILGACTYITLSWGGSDTAAEIAKLIPAEYRPTPSFLDDHFWLSERNIDEGRYYTMLTSTLMHADLQHLLYNTIGMLSCVSMVSPATFVLVWIGAGISSSLFTLYAWKHRLPFGLSDKEPPSRLVDRRACGASGSLFGIFAALAIRNPRMTMMIIPIPVGIPAWVLLSTAVGYSLVAMREGWQSSIGHAGHLGGTAFGLVYGVASLALRVRRF